MRIIIILIFLSGCAHQPAYRAPQHLGKRMVEIGNSVLTCVETPVFFYIAKSQQKNAWIINNKVYFTEGLFEFDDNILKFIMAHEMSHLKLGHLKNIKVISYATTGVMMVINSIIPGAGLLNYLVNPAIVNTFSKKQEFEADSLASQTCLCLGISIETQINILKNMQTNFKEGGGLWDQHPSWDDRIANIKEP